MKTTQMKVSELKFAENNVRKHPEKQIKELQRSIKMFGQIRPVVVDDNNIILAGNGLVKALKEMGEETANVLKMKNLSENDKKKLMIADNRIYSLGFDDNENIFELLSELDGDYDVPGYEEDLLQNLLAEEDEIDETLETYGKVEPSDIETFNKNDEKIKEQAKNEPFVDKEEYEEEMKKAERGELQPPEDHSNEYLEKRKCPRCDGAGWL